MNLKLKKWMIPIGSAVALSTPVAVVIACNEPTTTTSSNVSIRAQNLQQVKVTGDSHNIKFVVPAELTNVDANGVLKAVGSRQALEVYGRTNLLLGSSLPNEDFKNNLSFMPLALLEAYMAEELFFDNGRLVIKNDRGTVDVLNTYKDNFGFTSQNVIKPQLLGAWSKAEFYLKYRVLPGFSANSTELEQEVAINSAELKTYVNLDNTFANNESERIVANQALNFAATSDQTAVKWLGSGALSTLPTSWSTYASAASYKSGAVTSPSAELPSAFVYEPKKRKLLLELTPLEGYAFSKNALDISELAKLSSIRTKVDAAPEYVNLDLSKAALNIVNGLIKFDTSALKLPEGADVEFTVSGLPNWYSNINSLTDALAASRTTNLNLDTVMARIGGIATSATEFFVVNNKQARAVSPQGLTIASTKAFFDDTMSKLQVDLENSTASSLLWLNEPTLPSGLENAVERIEYVIGPQLFASDFDASTPWSATLAKAAPLEGGMSALRLWARLVPKAGFFLAPAMKDLTDSSNLRIFLTNLSPVDTSPIATAGQALSLSDNSTHDALNWSSSLSVPSNLTASVARLEYLSGDFATAELARSAPNNLWLSSLPTEVDPVASKRHLWMRLVPQLGARLTVSLVDLTSTSKVQAIKTKIDALANYSSYSSANVVFSTQGGSLVISEPLLPQGSSLQYRYNENAPWLDRADFLTEIKAVTSLPTLDSINVRLVAQNSDYILLNNKTGKPRVSDVTNIVWTAPFFEALGKLTVDTTRASLSELIWTFKPELSEELAEGIERVEYLISDDVDADSANNRGGWSSELPTQVSPDLKIRNLWVRLVPKANALVLPAMIRSFATSTTLIDQLAATLVDTSSLVQALRFDNSVTEDSTHDALSYVSEFDLSVFSEFADSVANVEYLSGNYPDATSAAAANAWSSTRPTKVDYASTSRYFWARINAKPGYRLNTSLVDLTADSRVRNVRSKIDATPEYAALDLSKLKFDGAVVAFNVMFNDAALNEADSLPSGTELQYQISPKNQAASAWLNLAAFKRFLASNVGSFDAADLATTKARLSLVSATSRQYVLVDAKETSVDVSSWKLNLESDVPLDALIALQRFISANLVADEDGNQKVSVNTNVVWLNTDFKLPIGIGKIEYLSGNFATSESALAAPSAAWRSTLPTVINFNHEQRHLWTRITPAAGYQFSGSGLVELTASSKIQEVVSLVDSQFGFASLNLSKITLSGSLDKAVLDTSAITVPVGAKLLFMINNSVVIGQQLTPENLAQYIADNISTYRESPITQVDAYLVTSDNKKYLISNSKQNSIDISNLAAASTR